MAGDGEQETDYESDPEEVKMSLKMRRKEASDDEDGEVEEERDGEMHSKAGIADSEAESDGQGGAAEYDEEYDDEEYYDELEDGDEYDEEREGDRRGGREVEDMAGETKVAQEMAESGEANPQDQNQGEEKEKKENEPFAVPTSGAFYMHDDRFRDNAGGRHRRTFGGRKLWESKDDRKWGHDKFEEMNVQDRRYEEGRRPSKGYYRGHGRSRGSESGYNRGTRMRGYSGNISQNSAPKDVRGRGPRRYQPSMKYKGEVLPPQNKQSSKSLDKTSKSKSGSTVASGTNSNAEHESVSTKKAGSNLNSASPPFYPSGSSNRDVTMTQKREIQSGNHNRNTGLSAMDHSYPIPNSNSMWRGKNVIDSAGMERLHIGDPVSPASARPLNNAHLPSSASSTLSATQMPSSRGNTKGMTPSGPATFQPSQTSNQVNKAPTPTTQPQQRNPFQNRAQPLHPSVQPVCPRPVGVSQGSSPPKTGAGTGSLVYGGAQIMGPGGNLVAGHGDQNVPAFFPVMQFGSQHPGSVGVPAVGMAFPGYVAKPNGLGNSEMTWLPVLASAAGALGATYCPPYIAVDGTYHPQPPGQTSALPAPSKDSIPSKPNDELKPQQTAEVANHEFSQRQSKPRRYSEMSFSQ